MADGRNVNGLQAGCARVVAAERTALNCNGPGVAPVRDAVAGAGCI
jgi:hypothetical protein